MSENFFIPPFIDYSNHPGFKGLVADSKPADLPLLNDEIREIDRSIELFQKSYMENFNKALFEEKIGRRIDILQEYLKKEIGHQAVFPWLDAALIRLKEQLYDDCTYFNARHQYKSKNLNSFQIQKRVEEIHKDGFSVLNFDEKTRKELFELAAPHVKVLREMEFQGVYGDITGIPVNVHYDELGIQLNALLRRLNVFEILSDYMQAPVELEHCSFNRSWDKQTWFKDCYADVGLPTAKTAYMHHDDSIQHPKALLYLAPIKAENGPFQIIRGSHRWDKSEFLLRLGKALDNVYAKTFKPNFANEVYYRPCFKYPDERKKFLALPPQMRRSSHFGDDILDNSELSEQLLKNEVSFVNDDPVCVVFDGARAIHRGGQVESGERWALQLIFQIKEDKGLLKDFSTKARRMAGRIRRRYL